MDLYKGMNDAINQSFLSLNDSLNDNEPSKQLKLGDERRGYIIYSSTSFHFKSITWWDYMYPTSC